MGKKYKYFFYLNSFFELARTPPHTRYLIYYLLGGQFIVGDDYNIVVGIFIYFDCLVRV